MTASADDALAWAGVVGQRAALSAGTTTSTALVELVLARLAAAEPRLHVLTALRSEAARSEAADADAARGRGDTRPLLGIPLLVKESHAVAGLPGGAQGTASPPRNPERDAPLVAALRAAGAIVVGSTTMPELALWPFGPARNPWDASRTAGGSSSGSAAAVAAGLVAVATASDGGGSIRIPASYCGLVGLKAAPGQLPGGGGWRGLSVDGVLTRSVTDTAMVLDALTGGSALADVLAAPGRAPLRIGWSDRAPGPPHAGPDARAAVRETLGFLRAAGHVVEPVALPWRSAALAFVPRYLRGAADDRARLVDPAAVDRRSAAVTRLGAAVPLRAVAAARRRGDMLAAGFRGLPYDLLLLPTTPTAAPTAATAEGAAPLRTLLLANRAGPYTYPVNAAGLASVSLPVTQTATGLPIGVQLVAPDADLGRLVSVAAQLETAARWTERRPPSAAGG